VGVGAAVVLVVVALVASVLVTALTPVGATTVVPDARAGGVSSPSPAPPPPPGAGPSSTASSSSSSSSLTEPVPPAAPALLVHVLGAVAAPGVYELGAGSRVVDGVAAAGGFAPTADSASVNLARPLVDGEQLRVLAVGESPPAPPAGGPAAAPSGGSGSGSGSGAGASGAAAPSLVNLNTATEIDLDTLPRIGPAMATRIVAYRDANGPFASVDDLLQIPGIGDKTLESLRPLLTL
jgi:competence protein ComEA